MNTANKLVIESVDVRLANIALTEDFVISRGKIDVANNVFVTMKLSGGAVGYGEIAPFEDLTGENQATSMHAARDVGEQLIGRTTAEHRGISAWMKNAAPAQVAARAMDCIHRDLHQPDRRDDAGNQHYRHRPGSTDGNHHAAGVCSTSQPCRTAVRS